MNALLSKRVQSAYSRPSRRPETNDQDGSMEKRPTTSMDTHGPYANAFDQNSFRSVDSSALSPSPNGSNRRRRAKTASISSTTNTRPGSRKLRTDEIDSLLRSLDHEDSFVVQVDCLADYRTLVQTIDLRKTPLDCQLLCALQRRENRIVQQNACRDTRFHSLIQMLSTPYTLTKIEENESNNTNRSTVPGY